MVRTHTTTTSTQESVAKPSTISMPPKAGPECRYAHHAPPSAATRVSRLRWPKACDEPLWIRGSSTIRSVPIMMRMISGKKRIASRELKTKLPGICNSRALLQLYPIGHVHLRLIQDARGHHPDGRQESGREPCRTRLSNV